MNLYHRIVGEGQPRLVLLHGLFGNHRTWEKVSRLLAASGHSCVSADLRGHGDSPKPPSGYTPQDYAFDVAELIDRLKINKPIIIGYSMGGRVGYFLAAQRDCPLAGLVIGDVGMDARPESWREVQSLVERLPRQFQDMESAETFLSTHFSKEETDYFRRNLSKNTPLQWLFSPAAMIETVRHGRAHDWIALAPKIQCPVMLVRGETSRELSREEAVRMTAGFSRGAFVEIPGVGHELHESRPKAFANIVSSWIRNSALV